MDGNAGYGTAPRRIVAHLSIRGEALAIHADGEGELFVECHWGKDSNAKNKRARRDPPAGSSKSGWPRRVKLRTSGA